jgi:hypothetical protein
MYFDKYMTSHWQLAATFKIDGVYKLPVNYEMSLF